MTEQTKLEMTVEQFVVAVSRENDRLRSEIKWHEEENHRLREALHTIVCNTEPDAIKHRNYDHLAKDIYDCARAALGEGK